MNRLGIAVALSLLCVLPVHAAMTKAEAKELIAKHGLPETGEGMFGILNTSSPDAPKLVAAFLTLGVRADQPVTYETDGGGKLTRYPLNYLLMFACGDPTCTAMTKQLVDAGADPNTTDPENDWAALSQAYNCPNVIRVLLAAPKKPDVNRVDRNGNTVMHNVVVFADESHKVEIIRMLLDAGFDVSRARKGLLEDARQDPEALAALGLQAPAKTSSRGATPKSAPAAAAEKVDWKSLPPYPERTAAQAKKLLTVPGAATTIDDEMWEGITSREPLRLHLALQAGADIHQKRNATGYTPLVLLAERCDEKDAEIETANAQMLIAGGADLTGLDANGANALNLAASHCPAGVIQAMLAAGMSATARSNLNTTALHNAISHGRADIVAILLDAGVDPKKEPYNVRALASGNPEIEALLKKKRK